MEEKKKFKLWLLPKLIIAIIIGLLLACFCKALLQMVILYRVNKHKDTKMETFIKAVLFYEKR